MKEGLKTLLMNWFNIEKINIDVEASTINTYHFNIFKLKSRHFEILKFRGFIFLFKIAHLYFIIVKMNI